MDELKEARDHFFQIRRTVNPFGAYAMVEYDPHDLLPLKTTDIVGNIVRCYPDYRTLHPSLIVDPNGNRQACESDELGRTICNAVMGKDGENIGDSLEGVHQITRKELDLFMLDPRGSAKTLLGNASTRIVYDVSRFCSEGTKKKPTYSATISRETHASDKSAAEVKFQITFSYYDGFGRCVQTKQQAPSIQSGIPNWIASGWTIFNNKGLPVKQFEPFFDNTHDFTPDQRLGVSSILLYDPLNRVIATVQPNHTWTKSVFTPWKSTSFDANDTALLDPKTDVDIGHMIRILPDQEYLPTWFDSRIKGEMGQVEQICAEKTARHSGTPTELHFDPLGRTFVSVANNGEYGLYTTRTDIDIEGKLLQVIDPKDRVIEKYEYDMLGNLIY
jgi:hypothetical protein